MAAAIQIVAHDPIAISTGWNMIGGYENSALVSGLNHNTGWFNCSRNSIWMEWCIL